MKGRIRALLGTPTGAVSVVLLLAILVLAVIGPAVFGDAATTTDFLAILQPSSSAHPLGTDGAGRDILARTLVGTRLSLVLALVAVSIAAGIGLLFGAALVTIGGRTERVGGTVIDTWLGFPSILLSVLIIAILEPGAGAAAVAIGLSIAPFFARITLSSAAGVVNLDYVSAARLLGLSRVRIGTRYVLGSIADALVVAVFSMFGQALIAVSALSYLGLGVPADVGSSERYSIDWGRMLNEGIENFRQRPAGALGPAVAIAICGLAFGWFGDALGRTFNPRLVVRRRTYADISAADS